MYESYVVEQNTIRNAINSNPEGSSLTVRNVRFLDDADEEKEQESDSDEEDQQPQHFVDQKPGLQELEQTINTLIQQRQ